MPDSAFGPRPFYRVGHNPNSIPQVRAALNGGANAIEPGVNAYADRPNELCIGEASIIDPLHGCEPDAPPQVRAALNGGANAIEPDVNAYADRPNELCIGEASIIDPLHGCEPDAPPLAQYLDALHDIALQRPELTLVVFDCKPKIATPELGLTLLTEIRNRLTFDTGLNVIISVSDRSQGAIFDRIRQGLGPRENGALG